MLFLGIVSLLFFLFYLIWAPACVNLYVRRLHHAPRGEIATAIWWWLRWPSLVGILLQPVWGIAAKEMDAFDWFCFAVFLVFWFAFYSIGDDDYGKKLRRKTKEKVERVGTRLAVVPA